ncbi:TonB-dependent receptor [Rhodoligotrophos defluvii]|uniref:TonB-dependent receptor n=1 Tax=Rhodoligotrophos defluvii TaxID=2561934 RepID=UPI0010C9F3D2|nr:TonB-dependent receptor [Rhodoligotrophos defluvii]
MMKFSRQILLGSVAMAALFSVGGRVAAQVVELPPITVTTASPIMPVPEADRPGAEQEEAPGAPALPEAYPLTSFVPMTVVTAQEIEQRPGFTLGDVLFTEPGIISSTFAPGASRPIIRGLDNYRVRIQENGIGAHDVSALGEDHGVPIDPLATRQIEVIRGPATLRWGSEAIGGVVNATNNRIPVNIAPGTFDAVLNGAFSSVDEGLEGALLLDQRSTTAAIHADAFGRKAKSYDTPDGIQKNSAVETNGQSLGMAYFFGRGFIGSALTRFASIYEIPGGEEAELKTKIDMEQLKWTGKGEYYPVGGFLDAVRLWFGISRYAHDEIGLPHDHGHDHDHDHDHDHHAAHDDDHRHDHGHDHDHDHDHGQEEPHVHGTFENREYEGRIETQHRPFATGLGDVTGAWGLQVDHRNLSTKGEARAFIAPAETTQIAGYIFEELSLTPATRLQVAGRLEGVRVDGRAPIVPPDYVPPPDELETHAATRNFLPGSVSIGLLHELPFRVVGRLTAQYVERAPAAPELFSKGAHHASGTFEIGNPDLDEEGAITAEVGFAKALGAFRFDASAYYTRFDGFIYKRLTGLTCDEDFASCGEPDGEFDQVVYDQRNAEFYGVELKAQYDLLEIGGGTFGIAGQYDFVHATFSNGEYVPRMPPHRLGGGLYWSDGQWRARADLLHAFKQDQTSDFETDTPAYDLLNVEVSYTGQLGGNATAPWVTVGITGSNLLNDRIRNSASFKKNEVLLPGASAKLFASVKF